MPFDLILRGGRVVDPSQKLDAVTDVAFAGGKVAAVGSGLKARGRARIQAPKCATSRS
ncbi:putative amidohydrolase [Bradyrhizobium sp. LM2.7]